MVNQYMGHAQLPRELRLKMRMYYQLKFPGRRAFDEDMILSELSAPITHEVKIQKCRNVLSVLNILENEDPQVAYYLCEKLQRAVYLAGDHVVREGQETEGMYFISAGLVQVISKQKDDERVLTTLGAQSFFGEMSLINPTGETTASVVVKTYLEGFLLTKADYAWLERHHPVFREYLVSAARLRVSKMTESGQMTGNSIEAYESLYEVLDPTRRKLQRKLGASKPEPGTTKKRRGTIWSAAISTLTGGLLSEEDMGASERPPDGDAPQPQRRGSILKGVDNVRSSIRRASCRSACRSCRSHIDCSTSPSKTGAADSSTRGIKDSSCRRGVPNPNRVATQPTALIDPSTSFRVGSETGGAAPKPRAQRFCDPEGAQIV